MSRWWLLSLGSFFPCFGLQHGNVHFELLHSGQWALWAVLPPSVKLALELYCFVLHLLNSITASVIDLADLYQKLQSLSFGDNYGTGALLKVSRVSAQTYLCVSYWILCLDSFINNDWRQAQGNDSCLVKTFECLKQALAHILWSTQGKDCAIYDPIRWSLIGWKSNYTVAYWDHTLKGKQCKRTLQNVTQSCPTLCNPMDCSLPGSSVHGIFQAIVLEWIAISFSRGSSQPRDRIRVSHIVDRHFTVWATREVLNSVREPYKMLCCCCCRLCLCCQENPLLVFVFPHIQNCIFPRKIHWAPWWHK